MHPEPDYDSPEFRWDDYADFALGDDYRVSEQRSPGDQLADEVAEILDTLQDDAGSGIFRPQAAIRFAVDDLKAALQRYEQATSPQLTEPDSDF